MNKKQIVSKVFNKLQRLDRSLIFDQLREDDVSSSRVYDNLRSQLSKIENLQTRYQFVLCFSTNLRDLTKSFLENLKAELLSRPKKRYVLRKRKSQTEDNGNGKDNGTDEKNKKEVRPYKTNYLKRFHDDYYRILQKLTEYLKEIKREKHWIDEKKILAPLLELNVEYK